MTQTRNPRLLLLLGVALVALLGVLLFGDALFSPSAPPPPPGYVSRAMLGDAWPLTVEDGVLACRGSGGLGAVTFTTGERVYAVNGIAVQQRAGADITPITVSGRSMGALIDRGLALCQ